MVEAIKNYFLSHVTLADEFNTILADFLEDDAICYSIDPVPVEPILRPYRNGDYLGQYQFYFSSNEYYDNSVVQNISNLDFYDRFREEIEINNEKRILPEIDGIQSIECMSHGAIQDQTESGMAKYVIQMRITYYVDINKKLSQLNNKKEETHE